MGIFDSVAMGFATISPVVGLYSVVVVGMVVAGAAWVWVLPVALAGQCLLIAVYAELAGKFPLANGAYQWSRRLVGPRYGWFNGWVALCAYAVANTTIAYAGAFWALGVARDHADRHGGGDRGCRAGRDLLAGQRDRHRRPQDRAAARRRRRGDRLRRHRARAAAGVPGAGLLGAPKRRPAGGHGRRAPGRARCRRLGVHRLRCHRCRRRGDPRRGQARAACDLDRAAERRRARDPERVRDHARASGSGRGDCREGHRPGLDGGRGPHSATGRASRSR